MLDTYRTQTLPWTWCQQDLSLSSWDLVFLLSCSLLPGMPVTLMKQQKREFGVSEQWRQAQTFINKFLSSSGLLAVLAEPCPWQQTANMSRIIQTNRGGFGSQSRNHGLELKGDMSKFRAGQSETPPLSVLWNNPQLMQKERQRNWGVSLVPQQ